MPIHAFVIMYLITTPFVVRPLADLPRNGLF